MTSDADRALLIKIARDAIVAHVVGGLDRLRQGYGESRRSEAKAERAAPHLPERADPSSELASRRGGAFVTIHHRGELRGCIGHLEPDQLLTRVVAQCATSACSVDPRFPPVAADELPDIDVELSLLGPLESIGGPDDIEIGRHGLLVARDSRRGLLLPQVATEWKWDAITFLAQACRKAGLPIDAWKRGADVWRFEAEIVGESRSAKP